MCCTNNLLSLPESALLSRKSFLTFHGRASRSRSSSRMGARFSNFSTGLINLSIICQFFVKMALRPFAELQVLRGPNHIDTIERLSGKCIRRIPYVPLLLLPCSMHMKDMNQFLSWFPKWKYRNIISLQL